EIGAFGGGERLYLALSRYLHQQGIPHQIVSYHQRINLQEYADWPLRLHQLSPPTSPIARAQALSDYLLNFSRQHPDAPAPMLVGLQAPMHAAGGSFLRTHAPYHVMILDTPRLLAKGKKPALRTRLRTSFSDWVTRQGLCQARSISIMTDITAE